ncbi:MAG TPA: hypothetical protein VEQ40_04110, partial [Pyrinomonadaceae bacterium]|nr:hypothetical protein [Pyrinomonadaceae bacterium]
MIIPHFSRLTARVSALFLLTICLHLTALAGPQQPLAAIGYNLAMSQPSSHLFEVSIKVEVGGEANTEALD